MPGSRRNARLSDAEAVAMERGQEGGGDASGVAEGRSHQEEEEREDGRDRETGRVAVEEETVPTDDERSNSGRRRRRAWASSRRTQGWCHILLLGLVVGFGCIFVYSWVEAFREVKTKKAVLRTLLFENFSNKCRRWELTQFLGGGCSANHVLLSVPWLLRLPLREGRPT